MALELDEEEEEPEVVVRAVAVEALPPPVIVPVDVADVELDEAMEVLTTPVAVAE